MKRAFLAFLFVAFSSAALAQVQQSGNVTPGHNACWVTTGVINDCGVPSTTPYMLTNSPSSLTDGTTVTPDFSLGLQFNWTLTASGHTLANPANLSNALLGQRMVIYITQGGAGSNTITWGSVYKFSGGTKPTLSTAVSAVDRVICDIQTTTVLTCAATLNFQ